MKTHSNTIRLDCVEGQLKKNHEDITRLDEKLDKKMDEKLDEKFNNFEMMLTEKLMSMIAWGIPKENH
jgi:hypothetical protein